MVKANPIWVKATELSKVPKAGFSIIDGQSATWDFVSIA
jgi:hypothetical protein